MSESSNERIDRDKLVMAIAEQTGLKITKDDPILALIVAHDVVLDAYDRRWSGRVKEFIDALDERFEEMGKGWYRRAALFLEISIAVWSVLAFTGMCVLIWRIVQ